MQQLLFYEPNSYLTLISLKTVRHPTDDNTICDKKVSLGHTQACYH